MRIIDKLVEFLVLLTALLVLFSSAVRKVRVSGSSADIGPSNDKPTKSERDDGIDDSKSSQIVVNNFTKQAIPLKRATAFMVVFMGHSGSTAFITELKSHPQIQVELLEPVDHGIYQFNTDLALERVRDLIKRALVQGKTPGFKIRPFHIRNRPSAWQQLASEFDMRIFWQFRVNIMKQAIGEYRHRVLNDSSVVEGLRGKPSACDSRSGRRCRFSITDVHVLYGLLNEFSINDDLLVDAVRLLHRDDHLMAIKYEDYLYRRDETMKKALGFLGFPYHATSPMRWKASSDDLCYMLSNFQKVCKYFYACQLWRPYLDDYQNDCFCDPAMGPYFQHSFCYRNAWYQNTRSS